MKDINFSDVVHGNGSEAIMTFISLSQHFSELIEGLFYCCI